MFDHRVLAFGPELGHLVGALGGNGLPTRLRNRAGLLLRPCRPRGDEQQKCEPPNGPSRHPYFGALPVITVFVAISV